MCCVCCVLSVVCVRVSWRGQSRAGEDKRERHSEQLPRWCSHNRSIQQQKKPKPQNPNTAHHTSILRYLLLPCSSFLPYRSLISWSHNVRSMKKSPAPLSGIIIHSPGFLHIRAGFREDKNSSSFDLETSTQHILERQNLQTRRNLYNP